MGNHTFKRATIVITFIITLCLSLLSFTNGYAEDEKDKEVKAQKLPPLTVIGKDESLPTAIQVPESISGTKETIFKTSIDIQGGAEQISPYKAISMLPGVDIRSRDPFGLEISHRIRGKENRNIGETLEGLPLKGIGPGIALATMIDLENIESISLSKGAVSADSGFGYGSDNGMVDMIIKRPDDTFSGSIKQVLGSESFSRTYMRLDTGEVGNVARAFFSGSYTNADKWKGQGKSPDGRKNFTFGIAGLPGQPIEFELYGVYYDEKKHNYRGLSYAQTQDLSANMDFDYNPTLTGNSAQDIYYYDYNRQDFNTYTLFGKMKTSLTEQSSITLKPYYLHDEGNTYTGARGMVVDWMVNHDTMGIVLEYGYNLNNGEIKAGYWYQEDEAPGPPTSKKYRSTANLSFLGWERLVKVGNHKFTSPFITAQKIFGATTVSGGLKYLWQKQPDLTSYITTGLPDVGYKEALSLNPDVQLSVKGETFGIFLPNIGVIHQLTDTIALSASYGKNYNAPEYSIGSQITSLRSRLTDQQLQSLWDSVEPETSDNFDLGLNYTIGQGFIAPTAFYSLVKHVGGSFFDPDLNISYYQNTAEAKSYGLEIGTGYTFTPNLNASLALTYTQYEFTSDILAAGGSTIRSNGHQLPDVPEWMTNMSINWQMAGYRITPTVRYIGKRYVDVENQYSVGSFFLVDLALSKNFKIGQKHSLTFSASVTNLLDKEYISVISTADTSIGLDSPTYYPGAPRTFFGSLQYNF